MIWYWKIDIVLKRYLIRFDGFWIDDFRLAEDWWKFCFWRYPWSIAEISDGDGYGYGSTISLWRAKHWKDNWFYFENHPELDQFYLAFNRASKLKVDWNQLNSQRQLFQKNLDFILLVDEEHLRAPQTRPRHYLEDVLHWWNVKVYWWRLCMHQ